MSKIELRLSSLLPPAPEPPRTIYRDLSTLPDTVQQGITIRYVNLDDVDLYFRVTGSAPGYTFGTVDLGLLESGKWAQRNLDEFASRAKPGAELTEDITLTLRAYTDAAYTDLKWTDERTVTVVWIDSSDPGYTVDVLNNFDDGTPQGWGFHLVYGDSGGCAVATDQVRSPPYSLRAYVYKSSALGGICGWLYKGVATPDRHRVYAIIDVRCSRDEDVALNWLRIERDGKVSVWLGLDRSSTVDQIPKDKWIRIVVPLPRNKTFELRIEPYCYMTAKPRYIRWWIDDFKIISK